MHCRFCRAWNSEEEHRCQRCGRRLQPASPRPAPDTYPLADAVAPQFEALAGGENRAVSAEAASAKGLQTSLFREGPGSPKVIPIPTLTPVRADPPAPRKSSRAGSRPQPRRPADSQQHLNFPSARVGTDVEAVIYCDAPVALPSHRMMAAGIDFAMIMMGMGLFLGAYYFAGGVILMSRQTIPFFLTIAAVLGVFYRMLWALAGGDSFGTRAAGLRLVNFDGYTPDREQRMFRLVASCLSAGAAGLGLVWALVDEESLTWHDHITKTFPTIR